MKVVLAGPYPKGVPEAFQAHLPEGRFTVESAATEDAFAQITDADVIIIRVLKAPRQVFERMPSLKLVCRWGVGYDSVDIEAAGEHGVLVTNTPGANAQAVSDLALLLMLSVGRNLLSHTQSIRSGVWSNSMFTDNSITLFHKTVGLLGAGRIGRLVAAKAQAFGANVYYYDACRMPEEEERRLGMTYTDFNSLLAMSDILSLHIPLSEDNYHVIGERELAQMKRGAILINTARGGLIDEPALIRSLEADHIAGAGLDCVEEEPLSPQHPLVQNPGVVVTPHIGGSTRDISEVMVPMISNTILQFESGVEVDAVVNRKYLNTRQKVHK